MSRIEFLAFLGLLLLTGACSASYPTPPSDVVEIAQVQLTADRSEFPPGYRPIVRAVIVDTDGVLRPMTAPAVWFSSDLSVLRPLSAYTGHTALFEAVAPGRVRVYAVYDGLSGFTDLAVTEAPRP
ncbi:MAG: hypothetical protein AB7I13_07865 [Vicinamibacterales bacterium]